MLYELEIHYKSGSRYRMKGQDASDLLEELAERIADNDNNNRVDSFTIRPVRGTEKS